MTLEELLAVAEIVEKLTNRYRDQEAAHKAALTEIRASCNARTGADEKIIEGLRIQVQDMREEIIRVNEAHGRTKVENDGLLDELAAQRDAFTAEVRRIRRELCGGCDALRAEVERLMAQTPKHPVKVGEWVRRTKLPGAQSPVGIVKQVTVIRCDGDSYGFADGDFWSVDNCEPCTHQHPAQDGQWVRRTVASGTEPVGTMIQVQRSRTLHSEYVTRGAQVVPWAHCEPCDPPAATVKLAPKVGDTVRLVTHPERAQVAKHLRTALKWPWIDRWGVVGQTGKVVTPRVDVDGSVAVALDDSTVFARWPIACLEVVAEATHDTEVGKAAAEAALTTEPVADEIKVGDIIEVVSATHKLYTAPEDIGRRGMVTVTDGMRISVGEVPGYKLPIRGIVGKCDVRKVTT